jgi:ferredoxin-NADP reductase
MANPKRLRCTVSRIIRHDDRVSSVRLAPRSKAPSFRPGQFLHLALDPFDPTLGFWPESRVFSIASATNETDLLIVYAVKGPFTRRMWTELEVGKEIWVKLPFGQFTMEAEAQGRMVLVAGGTGITPYVSFVSSLLPDPAPVDVTLVYGVRKPELVIFDDVLKEAVERLDGFRLKLLIEEGAQGYTKLPAGPGRLSLDAVLEPMAGSDSATVYLSGPQEMIRILRDGLTAAGVAPDRIRIDEWE